MKTLGRHLLAELFGCDAARLDDVVLVEAQMLEAARAIGATVMGHAFHRYAPQGVSGAVLIAESHLAIHTWPEHGYAAIDVFTCGGLDPRPAFVSLASALGARATRTGEVVRGLPEHVAEARALLPEDVVVLAEAPPSGATGRRG